MTGVYCWARLEALLSRLRTAHRAMRPPGCDPPCRPAIPTSEWDLQHLPVPGTSRPLRADSRGWPPIPLGFGRSSRLVPEPTPPQEARSRAKGGVSAAEGWATPARPDRELVPGHRDFRSRPKGAPAVSEAGPMSTGRRVALGPVGDDGGGECSAAVLVAAGPARPRRSVRRGARFRAASAARPRLRPTSLGEAVTAASGASFYLPRVSSSTTRSRRSGRSSEASGFLPSWWWPM
jgi:hypothetical protein